MRRSSGPVQERNRYEHLWENREGNQNPQSSRKKAHMGLGEVKRSTAGAVEPTNAQPFIIL